MECINVVDHTPQLPLWGLSTISLSLSTHSHSLYDGIICPNRNKFDWHLFSTSQSHSHLVICQVLFSTKSNPNSSISIYSVAATTRITIHLFVYDGVTNMQINIYTCSLALQLLWREYIFTYIYLLIAACWQNQQNLEVVHTYLYQTISTLFVWIVTWDVMNGRSISDVNPWKVFKLQSTRILTIAVPPRFRIDTSTAGISASYSVWCASECILLNTQPDQTLFQVWFYSFGYMPSSRVWRKYQYLQESR